MKEREKEKKGRRKKERKIRNCQIQVSYAKQHVAFIYLVEGLSLSPLTQPPD